MNIYVGNLSPEMTEDELRQAFEAFGQVESGSILRDRASGEARGFGFVRMASNNEAQTAITEMNGKELGGRAINVAEGRQKTDHRSGGGRRGGFDSGGRGGGGGRGRSDSRNGGGGRSKRRY